MVIPPKIKIMAHEYSVNEINYLSVESGALGKCCSNTLKIEIENNVPESVRADTFMHEILEALKYLLQIELKHEHLQCLATGILAVIRDNNLDFRLEND